MKIIHTADIHLGSKMNNIKINSDKGERKIELFNAFYEMVEYAKKEKISVIMISGDLFDTEIPGSLHKKKFYRIVKNNPEIDFLYLKGNHDSLESYNEPCANLKEFNDNITSYEYGDVVISGLEMTKDNASSFYTGIHLDEKKTNIFMLHGQVVDSGAGLDKINLKSLRNLNINYLAMGHIHSFQEFEIDSKGIAVYPGCLLGRGFDECGEKGFVVVDVKDTITYEFIPSKFRKISELSFDCTGFEDEYQVLDAIKKANLFNSIDIYRLVLTGTFPQDITDLSLTIENGLKGDCYSITVKDKTKRKVDIKKYEGSTTFIANFIHSVNDSNLDEELKNKIVDIGLKALKKEEV